MARPSSLLVLACIVCMLSVSLVTATPGSMHQSAEERIAQLRQRLATAGRPAPHFDTTKPARLPDNVDPATAVKVQERLAKLQADAKHRAQREEAMIGTPTMRNLNAQAPEDVGAPVATPTQGRRLSSAIDFAALRAQHEEVMRQHTETMATFKQEHAAFLQEHAERMAALRTKLQDELPNGLSDEL